MSYQTKSNSGGRKKVGLKPVATPRRSARVSKDKGPAVVPIVLAKAKHREMYPIVLARAKHRKKGVPSLLP